jgi:hypothetical protein
MQFELLPGKLRAFTVSKLWWMGAVAALSFLAAAPGSCHQVDAPYRGGGVALHVTAEMYRIGDVYNPQGGVNVGKVYEAPLHSSHTGRITLEGVQAEAVGKFEAKLVGTSSIPAPTFEWEIVVDQENPSRYGSAMLIDDQDRTSTVGYSKEVQADTDGLCQTPEGPIVILIGDPHTITWDSLD